MTRARPSTTRVGRHAAARGIETVWTFGVQSEAVSRACAGRHFTQMQALLDTLARGPAAGSVLVKGSRSMKMERVVSAFTHTPGGLHAA